MTSGPGGDILDQTCVITRAVAEKHILSEQHSTGRGMGDLRPWSQQRDGRPQALVAAEVWETSGFGRSRGMGDLRPWSQQGDGRPQALVAAEGWETLGFGRSRGMGDLRPWSQQRDGRP
uniref:Uncharacterized protein n=1 Tax=Knipowitschia caucasica TaxID=637954 RepID=A0AAV2JED2_KNICA